MSELLRPVSENQRAVTDPSVLSLLTAKGVDKNDVEFAWDYCGSYPRTKKYINKKTGERILVSSNLPMARPDDNSVIVPLLEPGAGKWYIGNNLFSGEVSASGRIALSPVVDQQGGVQAGDETVWEPVLYLDGEAVSPVSGPALLGTDPLNSSYGSNVLRWDYGICERLIRVIEGRLCERWIFAHSPGGVVRIAHNHVGQFRLGPYAVDEDVEQVTLAQFGAAQFPLVISATLTVYPDADPESATVDGEVQGTLAAGDSWANIRARAGDIADDNNIDGQFSWFSHADSNKWLYIIRNIFLFDTSPLTAGAVISDAVFSLYMRDAGKNTASADSYAVHAVASAPASNTQLVAGDFDSLGATSFGNVGWSTTSGAYWDITLNATGLSAISKAGVTKLGIRWNHDMADSPTPTWEASAGVWANGYNSEKGAGYKPKLVITYITGWAGGKVGGVSSASAGKAGGVDLSNIGKIGGVS